MKKDINERVSVAINALASRLAGNRVKLLSAANVFRVLVRRNVV